MDLDKSKLNKTKKRKRNDSTSSNGSKKSISVISTRDYSSDSSLTSESEELSFESRKAISQIQNIPDCGEPSTSHMRLLKLLQKSDGRDVPLNSKKISKLLNGLQNKSSGAKYPLNSSASKLEALSSSSKFNDIFLRLVNAENSPSNNDDSGPSTSTGDEKKAISKLSKDTISSQLPTSKSIRKRRASVSLNSLIKQDPDLGYDPPSAKRQQRVPSIYQSQTDSVASSVYPSSLDDLLAQEIDTDSSSSTFHSTDIEYNGEVKQTGSSTTIPDSPHSFKNSDDADDSYSDLGCPHHSCEEDSLEETYIHSPYPARFRRSMPYHGECTPAQGPLEDSSSKSNSELEDKKALQFDEYANTVYCCMTPAAENDPSRQCPLPSLSWANANDVWQTMCKKDEQATGLRDPSMLERHPGLQPRMRAILLDWLIEVCEVYKLHRETYYLAVDYLDRYLTTKYRVQKTHLQLIGITCLFVAAKVEEIYPPKIGEFAYVTDGACQETDILHNEILLLQALDWDINPVTPMGWLGVYMQLNVKNRQPKTVSNRNVVHSTNKKEKGIIADEKICSIIDDAFIYPQFSGFEFVQTAQLLDLCSLDVGVAYFPYSVLAAAAMSHTFNKQTALRCSGLDWQTIQPCARWMEPFFTVTSTESEHLYIPEQNEQVASKFGLGHICSNICTDDSHIIQTHSITMTMFDRVTQIQEQLVTMAKTIRTEVSPGIGLTCPEGLLTPPASSRKSLDILDKDHSKTATKTKTKSATNFILTAKEKHGQNNQNYPVAITAGITPEEKQTAIEDKDSKKT